MAYVPFSGSADEPADKMRQILGPGAVDDMVRKAIMFSWMSAPEDKKTVEYVEAEVRRLFERALKESREDADAFGLGESL